MKATSLREWIFFGAAVCCLFAEGEAQTKSQVTLSLDEFQELFSSARLEDAERRLMDQRKMHEVEHKRILAELEGRSKTLDAEAARQRAAMFPDNFQVLLQKAGGLFNSSATESGVEGDVASFHLELTLRVLESKWTTVPIVNTTSCVADNWEVTWRAEGDNEFQATDPVTDADAMLLLREEQKVLATNRSGLFKISFDAYTRVGKSRNLSTLGLSSLLYPLSDFSLRVAVGASNSIRDFSVQPPSAVLQVYPSDGYTDIKATLPLTTENIQIRWLDVEKRTVTSEDSSKPVEESVGGADREQKEEEPQITATHDVLHTVGEGIVRSLHNLELKTTNEMSSPLNSVQFVVHGNGVRITSVLGHALQGWTAEDSNESPDAKLVLATFKSSQIESAVALQVHTEMDRQDSTVGHVELPRVQCKKVLRQTGHVAIIKDANVEVHERKILGLSRCEPSEIPSQLRLNVDRPIVLSYRYLSPQNSVVLSVKEHSALATLEATVDRVHYKALVTDTHTVHSLILVLQSTKLQYLELLGLPSTASMFTVLVNSVPVKPVDGERGGSSILVPLLIGLNPETANEGCSIRTSVEVNYISTHESLGRNGTLPLAPPHLDLPISVFTTHLRLPKSYEYAFSGDFGNKPLGSLEHPIPSAFSYTTGKRVVRKDYEFSGVDDAWPEDRGDGDSRKKGAVKIVTPNTGQSFYFQRLLVVDNVLELNVTYAKPTVKEISWWSRLLTF